MTHKQKVLRLLSDRKPHSHHELYALGCVAHSRISDLRRDGHNIVQWRENGHYLYQLKGALDRPATEEELAAVSSASNPGGMPQAQHDPSPAGADALPHPSRAPALLLFQDAPRGAYDDAA